MPDDLYDVTGRRALQVIQENESLCTGYPCDVVKNLAATIEKLERDKARLTSRINVLAESAKQVCSTQ